ncbi:MAG: SRPBCC domain-containing protein [Rhizobium sp.]|nr:SRPBCC domain-containing protein [Rhizobium sp.]
MEKLEIVSERHFDASAEALFAAFADPERLARWWGPHDFTNRITQFDFVPGGEWLITMTSFEGTDFDNRWTFQAVDVPKRILALHHEPMHVFTLEMTFEPVESGTRLVWRMQFDDTPENREIEHFIAAANQQNFDRLEAELGL